MNLTNFRNFTNSIRFIINHLSQGCTTLATTAGLSGKISSSHKSHEPDQLDNFMNFINFMTFPLSLFVTLLWDRHCSKRKKKQIFKSD